MFSHLIYRSWKPLQYEKYRAALDALGRDFFHEKLILDLGSGAGYFSSFLGEQSIPAEVIGLDVAPRTTVCGDGNNLPFKDASFDIVVAFDSLHLISENDFVRVLKPRGLVVAGTFLNNRRLDEQVQQRLSGFTMMKEFESAGREREYFIVAEKRQR